MKSWAIIVLSIALIWRAPAAELWSDAPHRSGTAVPLTSDTYVNVSRRVQPAVVYISTTQEILGHKAQPRFQGKPGEDDERFEDFFEYFGPRFFEHFFSMPPGRQQAPLQGLGSGFLIHKDGYLVTNNHVVEKASEITVTLQDGADFPAKVVGADGQTDLALLKIDAGRSLPIINFGDSDTLRVGDVVIAVGNPFGLDHTMTQGIVSQKERTIGAGKYDQFIQTDASINPGNSGGPLLDIHGDVVGINTAIKGINTGIGFAIPINLAKEILAQLRSTGKVTRGKLGVYIQKVTKTLQRSFKLDEARGALVSQVIPGSPAAKAGIQSGDVIVRFDGKDVPDNVKLPALVAHTPVGKSVEVVLIREGKERKVRVVIEKLEDEEGAPAAPEPPTVGELGLEVQELTATLRREFGLGAEASGVILTTIDAASPAFLAGLRRGDIILDINRKKINGLADYRKAIAGLKKGDNLLFLVRRGGGTLFIAFTL